MSDIFTPLLQSYGRLMMDRVDAVTATADAPRQRLLPIMAALLNGREALRHQEVDTAIERFADAGAHLALVAFPTGPAETCTLDFVGTQRHRLTEAAEAGRDDWLRRPARHHFDRALANHTSVAYLIDPEHHRVLDVGRLRAQAADVANYLVFFLHIAGVELPCAPRVTEEVAG